jgi:HEPN domain-containing protein
MGVVTMFSNDKAEYWLGLCDNDLEVAKLLLEGKKYLYCGYFCHQVVEKAIKAIVASNTNKTPTKTHNHTFLAKEAGIWEELSNEQLILFGKLHPMQIEARYPDYKQNVAQTLNLKNCKIMLKQTEEFLCWVKQKLEK